MAVAGDAENGSLTAATASSSARTPAKMHAEDVYEWLARRRGDEIPQDRILTAIRTAAGVVPLGGRAPASAASTALISAPSGSKDTAEDVFLDVLLTCAALPASAARDQKKTALKSFVTGELSISIPSSSDDGDTWWRSLFRARDAYFSSRRAFFLVRIELLRIAAFQASARLHPQAALVQDVVKQLLKDGLVDALLEEIAGRESLIVPSFYAHLRSDVPAQSERYLRAAQHAWERQLLDEEELLRELLLLALHVANERVPLSSATQTVQSLLLWPAVVVPELFSQHSLAVPLLERKLHRVAAIGSLLALRLLHRVSQSQLDGEWNAIAAWTSEYVLPEAWRVDVDDHHVELCEQLTHSGIVLVAWAALLAKVYRRVSESPSSSSTIDQSQLESDLQSVLKASEEARGFQQMRDVLRSLVFDSSVSQAAYSSFAFLQSISGNPNNASSWTLPSQSAVSKAATVADDSVRVAVFQIVGAAFLDDALSALGYVEHLEEAVQLNAMVKLIRPVLANATVADAVLQERPIGASAPEFGSALYALVAESRATWPENLLAGLRVFTALCAPIKPSTPPSPHTRSPAVQLALKELSKKRKWNASASQGNPWRALPPDEYLEFIPEQERVVCRRTFAYTDEQDRVVVQAGTQGVVDQDDDGNALVQWQLQTEYRTAWESLLATLETLVDQIQSQPLVAIDSVEMETFTAFLEWLVQASHGADASIVVTQILQQWAYARLKQWWREMALPGGSSSSADGEGGIPAVLFRNKVSLTVLQSASREDLVTWGVHDRFTREQILSRIAFPEGASSAAAHQQRRAASRDELERDGLTHFLRMLLGFLDGFVNDHAGVIDANGDVVEWSSKQLHFISSILAVLAKLTSTQDICIDVLMHELGGGSQECVQLVLKSSRKLFEYHESVAGTYPGLFAALTVLLNISRWSISQEATLLQRGASASGEFTTAERHWFVAIVEFVMEIISTHETWKFVKTVDKWSLLDRCFRTFTALLSATYRSRESGVLLEFQDALRQTIVTDTPLLMKILRSACRLVVNDTGVSSVARDDDYSTSSFSLTSKTQGKDDGSALYPLVFEREVDNGSTGLLARERLVASSLRLLEIVMTQQQSGASSSYNVTSLLLLPIDGDGIQERSVLNLATLCAGYLAYPLSKNADIVHASVKMLRRAAEAMAANNDSFEIDQQRSLVTLFRENSDLEFVRDALLNLVRTPSADAIVLRGEVLELLTTCLDHQPGFFAVVVLESDNDVKAKRLVAMLERFLESSDKLLDAHTDVLCSILRFLCHIWRGGVKERRKLHSQIADALRSSSRFWKNLTQVLRARLPLSMDQDDGDDDEVWMDDDGEHGVGGVSSLGRSGVYGSLARGFVLEIVACEWHYQCSDGKSADAHPLAAVLDSFREEGLYAHWLRTFTRLDYTASRFAQVASSVKECVLAFPGDFVARDCDGESVLAYHENVAAAVRALQWQLEPAMKRETDSSSLKAMWKRAQWSTTVSANAAAQIFALARWKVFMELYSLQFSTSGADEEDTSNSSSLTPVAASSSERRKRKESMIASPPRTVRADAPVSPLHHSATSSHFSGDRTSYGMVQVLSETIVYQLQRHERDSSMGFDIFTLSHLKHLVDLLVAMLHHQIRVVLRKTRDPKLSATRPRDTNRLRGALRLTVARSIELLAVVERAARQVFDSSTKLLRASRSQNGVVDDARSSSVQQSALWERLAGGSFGQQLQSLTDDVRASLLTAALLLTRHITSQYAAQDAVLPHEHLQRAVVLQVKLTQHAIESIKLCDSTTSASKGDADDAAADGRLFRISWSLLHALLDDFTALTDHEKQKFKLDAIVSLGPLIALLQHETNGIRALFEIVLNRFHDATVSPASTASRIQACGVLKGLAAIVWSPKNAELCRHVMMNEQSARGFSVLRFFAQKLVPCLLERMESEQATAGGARGYRTSQDDGLERSSAHQAWCSVLMTAAGLVRQLPATTTAADNSSSVWEFVASAETLLAAALNSTTRLSRAVVEEQACVLTFLNALSATAARRKQWREMLPKNCVVLMEQSRLGLRRACVLLGNSSYTATRKREQITQMQKKPRRLSVTAWPLSSSPRSLMASSSASLTFARQTLLHEHLEPTTPRERREPSAFYGEMETKLVHVAEQGTHLLLKWTAGVTSRASTVSVQGSRFIDDEQLIPLLSLVAPSDSLVMSCEPSVGHLCIAMEFCVDQLKKLDGNDKTHKVAVEVAVNALQTSALLFLKTYLIHLDQQDQPEKLQDQQSDLAAFFEQLLDELSESREASARVDVAFLQQILQVVQIKLN